jgi:Capsule polysaccharide biosynthesis protein
MRFLFVTLQFVESDFYGEVAAELSDRGHDMALVTVSPRSAAKVGQRVRTYCMSELVAETELGGPLEVEVARVEAAYDTPTLRDVYRTDWPCRGRPEAWCLERTVRHFDAMERLFEREKPDALFLDVGGETLRTVALLVARRRGVTSLFPFYTIFPRPLRLYVDTMHAPIVDPGDLRPLSAQERAEVEEFVADFTLRAQPIRGYRRAPTLRTHWRRLIRHTAVKLTVDRRNEYLRPDVWIRGFAVEALRRRAAQLVYRPRDVARPYVYFPLHVSDDYKIARVIPQWSDQVAVIAQVADALPAGYDVVVKEHPAAIGRTPIETLRRIARIPNVRVVPPETSSHGLIRDAAAVTVISSTVGLEALLYAKPVLTIGRPFYAGAGVTMDVDSTAELREAIPAIVRGAPDRERILEFLYASMQRCYPGAPVQVDRSRENALRLAGTLDSFVRERGGGSGRDGAGALRRVRDPAL